jgi:site-specific DNA recombinase
MSEIKYFLYTRKSSESEDRQVQSIDDQIDRLKVMADQFKLKIVDIYKESKSAKQPNNRPMFSEMLERIEKGEANGILCWQMNRLSRNPVDSGTLQWMLQKEIIQSIQTIDREYKPTDNAVIMSVESGVSNQFILDLSKNTKRGMQGRVDKGWMPNMAPLGYLNSKDDEGRGIIIEDPERFPLIRKMWDLMLTGNTSPTKIVRIANKEWGFRTRKMKRLGGKPMSESTIYRILNNRFYVGEISHRKEWHKGSHKQMVTVDEFDHVQKLLGRNSTIRPQKKEFAFTGFIRCGECGCLFTAETKTKHIKSTGEIKNYTYYHCTRKRRDISCSQISCISDTELEEQIERELSKLTIIPEFRSWALETLGREHEKEVTKRSSIYRSLQEAANQTQSQIDNLTRMRVRDLIDDEQYIKEHDLLKAQLAKTNEELAKTENRAERWLELTEDVFDFATYAHSAFLNGTLQTKREIMTALGSNPTIINGKLNVPPHPWLVPIINNAIALNEEFARLEPQESAINKRTTNSISTVGCTWLRGWGSNPRPSR